MTLKIPPTLPLPKEGTFFVEHVAGIAHDDEGRSALLFYESDTPKIIRLHLV